MATADHPPTPDTLTALREAEANEAKAQEARDAYNRQRDAFQEAMSAALKTYHLSEDDDLAPSLWEITTVFDDAIQALDRTAGVTTGRRLIEASRATKEAFIAHIEHLNTPPADGW